MGAVQLQLNIMGVINMDILLTKAFSQWEKCWQKDADHVNVILFLNTPF